DQEDDVGVRVDRARTVSAHRELVAGSRARGADVRVLVVPVDAPRREDALGVAVLARPADVVHHLVLAPLGARLADTPRDVVERLVPGDALEAVLAALADALHRVEDAVGIGDLVERRRSLRAVPPARAGVLRVPLELPDLERLLVHVREEPARGLAVEAPRRDEHVAPLDALAPRGLVHLPPVVP